MQAIVTKYLGPTTYRGSRIVARCQAKKITVPYTYESRNEHADGSPDQPPDRARPHEECRGHRQRQPRQHDEPKQPERRDRELPWASQEGAR